MLNLTSLAQQSLCPTLVNGRKIPCGLRCSKASTRLDKLDIPLMFLHSVDPDPGTFLGAIPTPAQGSVHPWTKEWILAGQGDAEGAVFDQGYIALRQSSRSEKAREHRDDDMILNISTSLAILLALAVPGIVAVDRGNPQIWLVSMDPLDPVEFNIDGYPDIKRSNLTLFQEEKARFYWADAATGAEPSYSAKFTVSFRDSATNTATAEVSRA